MLSFATRRLRENTWSDSRNSDTKSLRSDSSDPQLCVITHSARVFAIHMRST